MKMPATDPDLPTTGPRLWIVLARAYGAMADYVEMRVAAEGLCLSDFMVLEVLLHKGPLPISVIGQKVLLANASMTAAVDRLTERGLVLRQESTSDRRSRIVDLTPPGRDFIAELYERHAGDFEAVTSVLTTEEQHQLRGLLKRLGMAARDAAAKQDAEPARAAKRTPRAG